MSFPAIDVGTKARERKVILIDDDPLQLRIREAVLRGAGFDVATTTSADDALVTLQAESAETFGAIVTDHLMPNVSGVEFVRRVRRLNATVPVIVVSGMAEAESEYEGLNIVFRQKPCRPAELIALVQQVCE
ncbi:MAG TPA: response regulator [Terriglobales bacterium]|nr:response regulator [Terriglobales bacterium]